MDRLVLFGNVFSPAGESYGQPVADDRAYGSKGDDLQRQDRGDRMREKSFRPWIGHISEKIGPGVNRET